MNEPITTLQARARIVSKMVTNALGRHDLSMHHLKASQSLWADLMPNQRLQAEYMASIKQQRHRLSWQWHERLARRDVVTVMLRNLKLNSQNMYFTLYYVLMRDMWNA